MADSKERLLAAGLQVFSEKGYKAASVRAICDRAAVTINMISHHFGGKDGLLRAIISHYGTDLYVAPLRIIREPVQSKEDFAIRLRLFTSETLHAMIASKELLTILYNPAELADVVDLKQAYAQVFEYQGKYLKFLKSGVKIKAVRKDIDLSMLTGLLWDRMAFQVRYQAFMPDIFGAADITEPKYQRDWLDANIDLFMRGVVAGPHR
jgi:AcrR family transcriptional regulator